MDKAPLESDISKSEILEAISAFAEHTDKQFSALRADVDSLKSDVSFLKANAVLKASAVTKEYLDEKIVTLYGNSMSMDKKIDKHVDAVVDVLAENKTISPEQKKKLMSLEPFPKLSV
jgi:hypothetical protein